MAQLRLLPEKIKQRLSQVVWVRCHDFPALFANIGDSCLQVPEKSNESSVTKCEDKTEWADVNPRRDIVGLASTL